MDDRFTPAGVGLHFLSVAHLVRRVVDEHMVAEGLSLARTKVLQVLDRRGPLRQAALAAELGFAARSVTQAVEGLERDGLVERAPHPDDHRSKLVALTAEGSAALSAGTAAGEKVLRQIFGSLDQGQLANLEDLLGAIETGIATETKAPPPSGQGPGDSA